jgi:hypothetical protein
LAGRIGSHVGPRDRSGGKPIGRQSSSISHQLSRIRWGGHHRRSKCPYATSSTFIAFLAYCLHVILARRLHALAPGLTPRSVLEKFAAVQMIDVHRPTTDGRELLLTRYTEPEPELSLLLKKLKLELPVPITTQNYRQRARASDPAVVPTFGGRFQQSQLLRRLKMLQSAKIGQLRRLEHFWATK